MVLTACEPSQVDSAAPVTILGTVPTRPENRLLKESWFLRPAWEAPGCWVEPF